MKITDYFKYIKTAFDHMLGKRISPEVQIERAITEEENGFRQTKDAAVEIIANVNMIEREAARATEDAKAADENARITMKKAADETDETRKAQLISLARNYITERDAKTRAAERAEAQLPQMRQLKEQAESQVQVHSDRLKDMRTQSRELMLMAQTAKMQDSINKAQERLYLPTSSDATSMANVRDRIENDLEKSKARAQLNAQAPEIAAASIEAERRMIESNSALAEMANELGLADKFQLEAPATPALEAASDVADTVVDAVEVEEKA